MWNLIYNNLKVFIDPFIFFNLKNLDKRILLVNTLQDYFKHIEPNLCEVSFFYPRYIEDDLNTRRTFLPGDKVVLLEKPPINIIDIFVAHESLNNTELGNAVGKVNEFFSLAVENKCIFYLSDIEFTEDKKNDIETQFGIKIVNFNELFKNIEVYLQGFYNYFKFKESVYGISSPDLAHAMFDDFFNSTLKPFEFEISKSKLSQESRERVRSFFNNRYIDILVSIDQIRFFELQEKIRNIEIENVGNNFTNFSGFIRYHLNYYSLLLFGALDHLAWIINDIFQFGYNPEIKKDFYNVGFHKKNFLEKIEKQDTVLYNFIQSDDFQNWLFFFSKLRHLNAHREMFSASPILFTTDESEISDEEIDKIIYKDKPPVPKDIEHMFTPEFIENQKANDRHNYRVSKMKKGVEYSVVIAKDGKDYILDPVARIKIDTEMLQKLISKVFDVYKIKIKKDDVKENV